MTAAISRPMTVRSVSLDASDKLAALNKLLETAVQLISQVASDPLFLQLVQAFARMPPEDRKTVVDVIETEVEHRAVNARTSTLSRYSMVPNPNAQLYLRVFESRPEPVKDRDRDDMMFAILRAMRGAPAMLAPHIYAEWRPAVREVAEHLTDEERRAAQRVLTELLALMTYEDDEVPQAAAK